MSLLLLLHSHAPVASLSDNFDDNATDTSKWSVAPFVAPAYGANGTLVEQNRRVEITPVGGASIQAQGYTSLGFFDFTGGSSYICLTSSAAMPVGQIAFFNLGPSKSNYYGVYIEQIAGVVKILLVQCLNGTESIVGVQTDYNSVTHRWLRLRHGGSLDDTIYLDAAPASASNPPASGDWISLTSTVRNVNIPVDFVQQGFGSGTFQPVASVASVYFDGLNTFANAPPFSALSDNFDDNSRDTTLWGLSTFATANAPTFTVVEANQELEVTPAASTVGSAGYTSLNTYDLTNSTVYVKITLGGSLGNSQQVYFSVGPDANNRFDFIIDQVGQLNFQQGVNGSYSVLSHIAYNVGTHAWLRFRFDGTTLFFDAAPNTASDPPASGDWVNLFSVVPTISLHYCYVSLNSYCFNTTTTIPIKVMFDGLNTSVNLVGTYLYVGAGSRSSKYKGAQANDDAFYKGAHTAIFSH